jgi:hypothetical protein
MTTAMTTRKFIAKLMADVDNKADNDCCDAAMLTSMSANCALQLAAWNVFN